MQINLNSADLTQAVKDYIRQTLTIAEGSHIDIEFTAGRGDKGPRAAVEITPPGQTPPSKVPEVEADAEAEAGDPDQPDAEALAEGQQRDPLFVDHE